MIPNRGEFGDLSRMFPVLSYKNEVEPFCRLDMAAKEKIGGRYWTCAAAYSFLEVP